MKNDLKGDPLFITTKYAIAGAFGGMIMGAVYLYVILGLGSLLPGTNHGGPPVEAAMIAGCVVGAILGGVVGIRKSR
jgi:hypothetical protein